MRAVPRKNTKPEMIVRSTLHRLGYRFRLHRPDLRGTPDIVLPRFRLAIFVHGCFWHRHPNCRLASSPGTRVEFWQAKFERNIQRDAAAERTLRDLAWDVLILWECETRDLDALRAKLSSEIERPIPD
jgi:DNA mismatch endonuclease (patch repair protein)